MSKLYNDVHYREFHGEHATPTMKIQAAPLVVLASCAPLVFGHGQVHSVTTSYGTYAAADAYAAVDPTSPLRKLNTYGPAANFTGPDITCGVRSQLATH